MLSGIPSTLGLLELGVSHASALKGTRLAASGDYDGATRTLQTAFAFTLVLCVIVMFATIIVSNLFDLKVLLKIKYLSGREISMVISALFAHLSLGFFGGFINSWFMSSGLSTRGYFILANGRLVDLLITISLVSIKVDAQTLAWFLLLGQVIFLCVVTFHINRISMIRAVGFKHASIQELRKIIIPSLSFVSITFSQTLVLQSGIQILNQLATPAIVILYSMSRTLMRVVLQIGQISNHALRPIIATLKGQRKNREYRLFTEKISKLSLLVAILGYAILILFGPMIMKLWSSGEVVATRSELLAIGAHAVIYVSWFVISARKMAEESNQITAVAYLVGALLSLLVWSIPKLDKDLILAAGLALCVPEILALASQILVKRLNKL